MMERHEDSIAFYVTPDEWQEHKTLVESIDRTLRGSEAEGTIGLLGRVKRLERIAWFLAGGVAATLVERAPDWFDVVAKVVP